MARALYSASKDDLDTVVCFLDDQEIGLDPKKTIKPAVDFLSQGSLAQSAAIKAERLKGPGERKIPWWRVPLTYLKTLCAASKWIVVGWCRNWHNC